MHRCRKGLGLPRAFQRRIGLGCPRQTRRDCGSGGIFQSLGRIRKRKRLRIEVPPKTVMHVSFAREIPLIF